MKRAKLNPTPRLALALFLAALPSTLPGMLWLSLLLVGLVLVAALVDLLTSRRVIEAERRLEGALALGVENQISLSFRCQGGPVRLEVRDDLPLHAERIGEWPTLALKPGDGWTESGYQLRPMRRGQHLIGPLHGRYPSPLGLWQRRLTWPLVAQARVYPNLRPARHFEIAIRQGRFLEGLKRARVRGTGTDFESLREYQEGDSYRAINWSATARRGNLVTNLYQVDRSQPIMLLLDAGRMMTPQVGGLSRLDHSLNAALILATVAAERGDQLGMMLFGSEVKAFVPPRKGRGQVMALVESLYDVEAEQVEPDYARMIGWFRAKHKKRSLVLLFTDLVDPKINEGLINHLSPLAAHHLVLLVCLSDPALLALSRSLPTDSQGVYQKASALEVLAQRAETRAKLQSRGIRVIDVPPEQFSTAVVNQYLLIKEQGRL